MAAASAGLGTDNLVKVQCNDQGQMLPHALDQALVTAQEQGKVRMVFRPRDVTANHRNKDAFLPRDEFLSVG